MGFKNIDFSKKDLMGGGSCWMFPTKTSQLEIMAAIERPRCN